MPIKQWIAAVAVVAAGLALSPQDDRPSEPAKDGTAGRATQFVSPNESRSGTAASPSKELRQNRSARTLSGQKPPASGARKALGMEPKTAGGAADAPATVQPVQASDTGDRTAVRQAGGELARPVGPRVGGMPPAVPEPLEDLPSELPPILTNTGDSAPGASVSLTSLESGPQLGGIPTGPQSPALTISWAGPSGINVGEEAACELIIRNTGTTTAHDVAVQATIPGHVRFVSSHPESVATGKVPQWQLGQIEPRSERRIRVHIVPEGRGVVTATATVTFSTVATAHMRVEQPQLVLDIQAPSQVIVGDPMTFVLTVANPGTSPAPGVVVSTTLPQGLKHPNGSEIEYEIGTLAPMEERALQVNVTASELGSYTIRGVAQSGAKLKSEADAQVAVVEPGLALKVGGPSLRYLGREATYTLTAYNPGSGPANNVQLAATIPAGFQFVRASDGGKHDWTSRSVSWFISELDPDQPREIQLTLLASGDGAQTLQAVAAAERGLKAQAQATTRVEGVSALLLELVDVDDPIEVGAETLYEIRVTNQGSKPATNIQIVAELPDEMQPLDWKGPVPGRVEGRHVVFDRLPKLGARADATYRVRVRGSAAGDLRFRAKLTSDVLQSPVIKEESTRVYMD